MEVSTLYSPQSHFFDRRPHSGFPLYSPGTQDSYYSREMPSPHSRETASHNYQLHGPPYDQAPKVSLPSISDLLNFSREREANMQPPVAASQPRAQPAWHAPKTYGAQLKVETANIDPRLQRPLSPPMPGSAHPGSAPALQRSPLLHPPHSPSYARSAGAEHTSQYPEYPTYDSQKRLSTASHVSHSSIHSTGSVHSSPDAAKSTISSFSTHTSAPRGLPEQRPLPADFPPASSPRRLSPPVSAREVSHPYQQPSMQRPNSSYPTQPSSQRPPLVSQNSAASIVTAASAGTSRLEDRYVCPSCSKAFSRPSSLRIHSHSHTGEKPFRCPRKGCGKAFSVRSNMKRHERGCHIDATGRRSSADEDMHSPESQA